jgi:hypothetical protein
MTWGAENYPCFLLVWEKSPLEFGQEVSIILVGSGRPIISVLLYIKIPVYSVRRNTMFEPIVFISHFKVKQGKHELKGKSEPTGIRVLRVLGS